MPQTCKIIHVDMDAFYASVERRDNPNLKGEPVIVGGDPQSRGVVAACSYEASKSGIHWAMICPTAYLRCRHAAFIQPRFDYSITLSFQFDGFHSI
jgi:DNA polymerase-4